MIRLVVPALWFFDYLDRLGSEVDPNKDRILICRGRGKSVEIEVHPDVLKDMKSDALHYAGGTVANGWDEGAIPYCRSAARALKAINACTVEN
jgi:hypothetical protein